MKQIILIFVLCLVAYNTATAQCSPPCTGTNEVCVCTTTYTYDAAGNRDKRSQACFCQIPRLAHNPNTPQDSTANIAVTDNATIATETATIAQIYPNPTTSRITIVFTQTVEKATILVSDAVGSQVSKYAVSGTEYSIDMNTLPSGTYFFTLQTETVRTTHRVIKTDK